jgi:hypothetical protein
MPRGVYKRRSKVARSVTPVVAVPTETVQEIDARIRDTFEVLEQVSQGVISGYVRSVIVSGAAGCGKTYTLENALSKAEEQGIIRYQSVRGACSAIGLYRLLYDSSEPGQVLVIDDCDSVFGDLDSLNLLKSALDSSKVRRIHWNKESRILEGEGVPRSFEFEGSVAFITNIDFSSEISAEKKLSPHYNALLSRCLYLDLGIHTKQEILVRIGQVVLGEKFLDENAISHSQAGKMMDWLHNNIHRVRTLSIRTVLQLASLVKIRSDWETMARVVMCQR